MLTKENIPTHFVMDIVAGRSRWKEVTRSFSAIRMTEGVKGDDGERNKTDGNKVISSLSWIKE